MLDQDLAQLAAAGPEVSLEGLEQGVWVKVEGLHRLRRLEHLTSRVQWATLAATLIASTAVGVALAQPAAARRPVMQISSVVASLAPSTLLGSAH